MSEQASTSDLKRKHPDAWQHGYNSGAIHFSYLNLNYTKDEVAAWSEGYMAGKQAISNKRNTLSTHSVP